MPLEAALDMSREASLLALTLSAPILGVGLLVGLIISFAQAVTQLQEQTLSFVPKIIGMVLVSIIAMPWLVSKLMTFSAQMFGPLPAGG